ncbi:MAG: acetyl-CoA carboxylase biotin carboxyl carrier protein subunit [Gammaproteobacteria bacterium]|nr:MAG: acetyl-CoA carboxylase biotin carboxyl carrier protein subunit [Gammaproteobacteria bacterium]
MDIRKIKKLIELLEESGISELEVRQGEESVRIARFAAAAPAAVAAPAVQAAPPPPTEAPAAGESEAAGADALPPGHVITSPMVGTYYEAPSPGAPPFVKLGQRVSAGQTLCIIEAMKILNQIESDVDGEVKAILCQNGDPVEYGQPLFVIG